VAVAIVVALAIGLWPVHANVIGDASYSCGSGFLHSTHDWNVDSSTLEFQRTSTDTGTGLPASVCPDKVDSRRDLALLLAGFSLAIGLLSMLFLDRPREPSFGTTLFASRRRSTARPPLPIARVQPEEPSTQ
jgi:hypothetical protein